MKYGRLTIIKAAKSVRRNRMVLCLCDCGKKTIASISSLNHKTTKSCGCLKNEKSRQRMTAMNTTHGLSKLSEYHIWQGIKTRCYFKNCAEYCRYGGRGIKMCNEWKNSFAEFINSVGRRPTKNHSIDRIDNDGHYEPGNCKWSTRIEQQNNTSMNKFYEWNGQRRTLTDWARQCGIAPSTLHARINTRKWPISKAVTRGRWHKMYNHRI